MERRKEGGERRIKLGKMDEWTDGQSRQAGSQIPPNAPTQPPMAQLVAPRLSFTEKYREGLLKAEAMEAALWRPQNQHSHPVRVNRPPTSGLGLLLGGEGGTGKGGKLGWCGGRLWGPHKRAGEQAGHVHTHRSAWASRPRP